MSEHDETIDGMKPLFERAEREHKWFFCRYQGLWFSPAELRKAQSDGKFVWGACNWELHDPMVHLRHLEEAVSSAQNEVDEFKKRIGVSDETNKCSCGTPTLR